MEMSRQRLRPSLGETTNIVCPRCSGQGTIRDIGSSALSILRLIEEEAFKDKTAQVRVIAPIPVATYLLNEKRDKLTEIEQRQKIKVVIAASSALETPHFELERLRDDNKEVVDAEHSYNLSAKTVEEETIEASIPAPIEREEAAVQSIRPSKPAPVSEPTVNSDKAVAQATLLQRMSQRIASWFKPEQPATETTEQNEPPKQTKQSPRKGDKRRPDRKRTRNQNQEGGRNRNNQQNRNDNQDNKRDEQSRNKRHQRDNEQNRRGDNKQRNRNDNNRNDNRKNDKRTDDNAQEKPRK